VRGKSKPKAKKSKQTPRAKPANKLAAAEKSARRIAK
jgi:hypothetical protein